MKLEVLLDLISDRQLAEYVAWLDEHPDSDEEDSLDFLMNILTKRQWEDINYFLETDDFNAVPYSNWYGACIHPDGRCFEATMQDCRMLGGKFQGQGTSCGGYQRPRLMGSESDFRDQCYECGTKSHHTCSQCEHRWCNRHWSQYEDQPMCYRCANDWILFNAPEGQVFRDPSSTSDPRLKGDNPPKSVTSYLSKHPEVANLYDDDDASVMMKGVIIGCLIGAVGTIFGNLASEMIVDRWKINPDFVWDKD